LPDKTVYSGTDIVGRTEEVNQQIEVQSVISKTFGGIVSDSVIAIKKWLGIITRPTRATSPLGALESVKNLKFNKTMNAMSLRDGTTVHAATYVDLSGATTLTAINDFFPLSTETPSADTIDILCGTDGSSNKHIFQRHFWEGTGLADNDNNDKYIKWGESKSGTIGSVTTNTIVFPDATGVTDYYNGWVVGNATLGYGNLYITDSSTTGGNTTITTAETVPSGWVGTNSILLYRSFHDNLAFSPTYSTVTERPPVALQQGNAILFSGGMGSTVGLKPIWSGYLNKTFFVGATNKTGGVNYTGTYVTEAEIKSTNGVSWTNTVISEATNPLTVGKWFMGVIPETDDGERGNPMSSLVGYSVTNATSAIRSQFFIEFGQLNKRLRYLNIFMGKAPNDTDTTIAWENLYYIRRIDLLTTATTWQETAGSTIGYFDTGYLTFTNADWNNNTQESLATHLGHTLCTSTTASFSEAVFLNNRLFIAKYYDYVDAVEYLDQIRYTDFAGNGKAQLNVLCNLDGATQSTIEQGDPTSVQALRRYQDKLLILKDASCYYIPVTDDPINWILVTISNTVGCTVPRTAVVTPTMVIWCQDGEDIYGWSGADVFSLGQNWLTTFKALTLGTASSKGWYDIANKTYNFTYLLGTWYTMFLECPIPNGYIWAKNDFSRALLNIVGVSERAGRTYIIVLDTLITDMYSIFYFNPLATTDNTLAIAPYFKTAESRLDEKGILKLLKWYLTLTPTGGAGTLDCKVTIGSNVTTYSNITKTNTLHARGIPFTACNGRSFQFEFNANATPATFTGLEIYELHFDYEMLPFIGDNTITT
jgi:hypothetical protein